MSHFETTPYSSFGGENSDMHRYDRLTLQEGVVRLHGQVIVSAEASEDKVQASEVSAEIQRL